MNNLSGMAEFSGFAGSSVREVKYDGAFLSEGAYEPGEVIPLHRHEQAFLSFLIDGDYWEGHGPEDLTCSPGLTVYHPPGDEHAVGLGRRGALCLNVELADRYLDEARSYFTLPDTRTELRDPDLACVMTKLRFELSHNDNMSALAVEGLLLESLALVGRSAARADNGSPAWLDRIIDRLRSDFQNQHRLDNLAREAGISPARLSSAFRRATGLTMSDFLRKMKVQYACRELTGHRCSLAEIAADAGFADQAHMTRIFRRTLGCTPGQFRKCAPH